MWKKLFIIMALSLSLILTAGVSVFAAENNDRTDFAQDARGTSNLQLSDEQKTAEEMLSGREYAKDELIVTFSSSTGNQTIRNEVEKEDAEVREIVRVDSDEKAAVVTVDEDTTLKEAIENLQEHDKVEYVQPNYRYKKMVTDDPLIGTTNYGKAYQIGLVRAKEAWDELTDTTKKSGYQPAKVAVVDTGCDLEHEDLQEEVNKNQSVLADSGKCTQLENDTDEHGTHVTGIIGATYGNGKGGAGIASGPDNNLAEVTAIGACADGENLYSSDLALGINYAKKKNIRVVNMSWGGYGEDPLIQKTIQDGYYNYEIVFVAAAGNGSTDEPSCPGAMSEVIGVMACGKTKLPTSFSDYGTAYDLTAPGYYIPSTVPDSEYALMSGTSMSSPVVAGVAALVLDAYPDLSAAQVKNILCATAEDLSDPGFDIYTGYGLVNAEDAVKAAKEAKEAEDAGTPVQATSIQVKENQRNQTLEVDETADPEVLIKPASCLQSVKWSSEAPDIASVDEKSGKITARAPGETKVVGTLNGKTVTVNVEVLGSVDVTGIRFLNKPSVLVVGDSYDMDAEVTPSNATRQEIFWYSSNESVVKVDTTTPVLEAVGAGTATITAKSWDEKVQKSFTVTVKPAVKSAAFTNKPAYVRLGKTATYKFKVTPSNAYTGDLKWKVSLTSKASISQKGVLTPKKAGKVYVIADFGEKRISTPVTILKKNYAGSDYKLKAKKKVVKKVRKAVLSWSNIPAAGGYQIWMKAPKASKYKYIGKTTKKTLTRTKLAKGKTRFKIRAWYKESGKVKYYSYSSVASVKY